MVLAASCAAIQGLFTWSGPFTVGLAVGAVIVNAINGMFRARLAPHVIKKGLKRLAPFLANGNSPLAVVAIRNVVQGIASRFHSVPDHVFRALGHAVGPVCFRGNLFLDTATTTAFPLSEILRINRLFSTACANTVPVRSESIEVFISRDNAPSIERGSREVDMSRHSGANHNTCVELY